MAQKLSTISELIWKTRYRHADEADIEASWQRVAHALASVEASQRTGWEQRFFDLQKGFRFLPGGRILAGAGTGQAVTLCNCFVMGEIQDDMESIINALKEGTLTMQQGGGVGYDFSTLRPAGLHTPRAGILAPGPVSCMRLWDSMCATLLSTGNRRGAMMGTLRCDHPDIAIFVDAKRQSGELRNFNLSVLVSDAFMQSVEGNKPWPLVFPIAGLVSEDRQRYPQRLERPWPGADQAVPCAVMDQLPARQLWQRIMRTNYDTAEPGVLFIDRIAQENNLYYRERISATNPCGEIPLPPYGACNLGSINLTAFVHAPFSDKARLDFVAIREVTAVATRLLDNVIDLSRYPLPQQHAQALGSRRIGLGITGLADTLILMRLDYRSPTARAMAIEILKTICHTAYRTSIELAHEKGPFPFLQTDAYLASPFIQRLPDEIQDAIAQHGIRNSHLIAIAPAGTISLLADNLSSGIEPVFEFGIRRQVKNRQGDAEWHSLTDPALRLWNALQAGKELPEYFVSASDLKPEEHLAMQSALQPYVDNAISKTVNIPADCSFDAFLPLYEKAWKLGLKGCTSFRPNPQTGSVLSIESLSGSRCCAVTQKKRLKISSVPRH